MSGWDIVVVDGQVATAHVTPGGDLAEHELTEDCVCGPFDELVPSRGGDRWVVVHQALDGRQ